MDERGPRLVHWLVDASLSQCQGHFREGQQRILESREGWIRLGCLTARFGDSKKPTAYSVSGK